MSFDRFLLAVESRDLSQADKILIRASSFPIEIKNNQNLLEGFENNKARHKIWIVQGVSFGYDLM